MHRDRTINHTMIAALAALVAVIGTVSSALAYETGYGPVQLVTAQQIDDPRDPARARISTLVLLARCHPTTRRSLSTRASKVSQRSPSPWHSTAASPT